MVQIFRFDFKSTRILRLRSVKAKYLKFLIYYKIIEWFFTAGAVRLSLSREKAWNHVVSHEFTFWKKIEFFKIKKKIKRKMARFYGFSKLLFI